MIFWGFLQLICHVFKTQYVLIIVHVISFHVFSFCSTNQPTQPNQINHQPATNKQQTISRTNIHRWATVETRRSVAAVEASSTPRAPSATGADGKFMAFVKFVNQTKRRNPKRFTKNGGKEKPGGGVWVYEFIHVLSIWNENQQGMSQNEGFILRKKQLVYKQKQSF